MTTMPLYRDNSPVTRKSTMIDAYEATVILEGLESKTFRCIIKRDEIKIVD